ncbi:competence protein ComK [Gracilibacillus phocaeensis]|uniref:competence protein ComK n=1 Tax=Gracilibacillus phocaeensis TaxID=2042304 RepID=UPI0013EF1AA8|nr:competence protein ComK [Gracilibacillus phocaeensis]
MTKRNYRITKETLAIKPKYDMEYSTTIIEQNGHVDRQEKPLDIIKENCLHYGASYQGRKEAVTYRLGYKQKVPIPISPERGIYAFPTKSATAEGCCWLFLHAIIAVEVVDNEVVVRLVNGERLVSDVSRYVLEEQMRKAGACRMVLG